MKTVLCLVEVLAGFKWRQASEPCQSSTSLTFSFLSLNDQLSKMPERKDKPYSMPWNSGSKRGKAFSIGEVFSLVIPYPWIFSAITAAPVRNDVAVLWGSWKLNPAPVFAELCQRENQLPKHPSWEWWDGCHLQMGRVQHLSASLTQRSHTFALHAYSQHWEHWPRLQDAEGQGSLEEWKSLKW